MISGSETKELGFKSKLKDLGEALKHSSNFNEFLKNVDSPRSQSGSGNSKSASHPPSLSLSLPRQSVRSVRSARSTSSKNPSKKEELVEEHVEKISDEIPEEVKKMPMFKKFKLITWSILFFVAMAFFMVKFYFPFHQEYVKDLIIKNPQLKSELLGKNVNSKKVLKVFRESAAKFLKLDEIKEQFGKFIEKFSIGSIHNNIVGDVNINTTESRLNMFKNFIQTSVSMGFTSASSVNSTAFSVMKQIPYFSYNILKSSGTITKNIAVPLFTGGAKLTSAGMSLAFTMITDILNDKNMYYHMDRANALRMKKFEKYYYY